MTAPLTPSQQALADARARCTIEVAARMTRPGEFPSIRDLVASAERVGVVPPDWRAERDVVRAAGFGRLKTGGLLGDWGALVSAADEAARWNASALDLLAVSRRSLAWCLADRPKGDPVAAILRPSRAVTTDDVHNERPVQPYYAQILAGWAGLLG